MLRSGAYSKAQLRHIELTAQAHAEESNVAMNAIAARFHLKYMKYFLAPSWPHPMLYFTGGFTGILQQSLAISEINLF